jgi:hypothetical protein
MVEFLHEYEAIANGHGLNDQEKVETIVRYTPHIISRFWRTLTGFSSGDWRTFRATLEDLYPEIRYIRAILNDFVNASARSLMRTEKDVIVYYRRFLHINSLLYDSQKLSDDARNEAFFNGFHPKDQKLIASRIFLIKPNFPGDSPFETRDVLTAAQRLFSENSFHRPLQVSLRDGADGPHYAEAIAALEQWWPEDYDSWRYHDRHFPEPTTEPEDGGELEDIIKKLRGLSARDTALVVRICMQRFPELAQDSATPDKPQMASAFTDQAPAIQPRAPPPSTFPEQPPVPTRQPWNSRPQRRIDGCAFCTQRGHHLRGCSIAEEYVDSGRATIKNGRLCLPTGQPIPNDGSGRGLKYGIDSWIAANSAPVTDSPLSVPRD